MSDTVLQKLDEHGVLLLTLNRPEKKNAFSNEQWQAFGEALEAADENPAVACVVELYRAVAWRTSRASPLSRCPTPTRGVAACTGWWARVSGAVDSWQAVTIRRAAARGSETAGRIRDMLVLLVKKWGGGPMRSSPVSYQCAETRWKV